MIIIIRRTNDMAYPRSALLSNLLLFFYSFILLLFYYFIILLFYYFIILFFSSFLTYFRPFSFSVGKSKVRFVVIHI